MFRTVFKLHPLFQLFIESQFRAAQCALIYIVKIQGNAAVSHIRVDVDTDVVVFQ